MNTGWGVLNFWDRTIDEEGAFDENFGADGEMRISSIDEFQVLSQSFLFF